MESMLEKDRSSEDMELVGTRSCGLLIKLRVLEVRVVVEVRCLEEVSLLDSPEVVVSVVESTLDEVIAFSENIEMISHKV